MDRIQPDFIQSEDGREAEGRRGIHGSEVPGTRTQSSLARVAKGILRFRDVGSFALPGQKARSSKYKHKLNFVLGTVTYIQGGEQHAQRELSQAERLESIHSGALRRGLLKCVIALSGGTSRRMGDREASYWRYRRSVVPAGTSSPGRKPRSSTGSGGCTAYRCDTSPSTLTFPAPVASPRARRPESLLPLQRKPVPPPPSRVCQRLRQRAASSCASHS